MNIKSPILSELETLAPALINVPRTLPYSLQDGYFDDLANHILAQIKVQNQLSNTTFSTETDSLSTPYLVPKDYFENFAGVILAKLVAEEHVVLHASIPAVPINPYTVSSDYFTTFSTQMFEKVGLLSFETLVADNKTTPYKVPVGYFSNFPNTIWNKINSLENAEIEFGKIFSNLNPYTVPTGYFEGLADEILLKVNPPITQDVPEGYFASLPNIILQKVRGLEVESELDEIAPLLNTINKAPVNYVPVGYFEALEPVTSKVEATVPAKVIGIKKKTNWFKNAIAACLIGTLGFTAYQLMDSPSSTTTIVNAGSQEIIPTTISANINVDEELAKVDDAALTSYLDNIEMPTEQATAHFNDINSGDVDAALLDISDEAIQQHLEETGGLSDKKN